jgi:hypothetical protein
MSNDIKVIESNEPKAKRLSTIEVPAEPERISTGIAGLDACLSESEDTLQGLPLGTSILLSGMPGGGKSTIATYMAAAQTGRESLIFHGEERAERVKSRWNRLGMKDADPYLSALKAGEDALDVIRDIANTDRGLGMTVIDSIQTVTWDGKRKYDAQYEAAEAIAGMVCSSGGVAVFVSHVSKTGKDHAGAAALAHLVDIHIHVTTNAKKAERILEIRKNRMGRAGFQVPLNITPSGLSVGVPAPLNPASGLSTARTQLEKATEKAYELLLEGKRLTGYDFDLANVSGGMWRAGLEMAAKRMVRDGFQVVEDKVKGRRGWQMIKDDKTGEPVMTDGEPMMLSSEDVNLIELT